MSESENGIVVWQALHPQMHSLSEVYGLHRQMHSLSEVCGFHPQIHSLSEVYGLHPQMHYLSEVCGLHPKMHSLSEVWFGSLKGFPHLKSMVHSVCHWNLIQPRSEVHNVYGVYGLARD